MSSQATSPSRGFLKRHAPASSPREAVSFGIAPAAVVARLLAARALPPRASPRALRLRRSSSSTRCRRDQLLGHLAVALQALHLVERPLVVVEAQPVHAVEDRLRPTAAWSARGRCPRSRRMNLPPWRRAYAQQNSAVRAPPMCR